MNGSYYPNPTFPNANPNPQFNNAQNPVVPPTADGNSAAMPSDMEQSYIENILRMNKGKKVSVYTSFPDADVWKDKKFEGIIEETGRDHLILSDPSNGKWYLVPMIYLNFMEFDEKINYDPYEIYKNVINK